MIVSRDCRHRRRHNHVYLQVFALRPQLHPAAPRHFGRGGAGSGRRARRHLGSAAEAVARVWR